jgi:SulP family sulfate permease
VALVALAQAAGVAPSMPNPDGSRSDANGDFTSQGIANLGGALFQSLPAGGSLSRTGVAAAAGARTRWAGVISGVFLALVVLLLGKLAERIPMPVIGGLILVVGCELIWGKRRDIALVWHTSKLSTAAMAATFLATTQLPLQQAIVLGAVLSLLLYCYQAARQVRLAGLRRDDATGAWSTTEPPARLPPGEVTVLAYDGTSFFAELPLLEARLPDPQGADGAVLVLSLRAAPDVPSSTIVKLLRRYATKLHDQGGRLLLAGLTPATAAVFQRAGLTDELGLDAVIPAQPEFFAALDQACADGRAWIRAHRTATTGPRTDETGHGPQPHP